MSLLTGNFDLHPGVPVHAGGNLIQSFYGLHIQDAAIGFKKNGREYAGIYIGIGLRVVEGLCIFDNCVRTRVFGFIQLIDNNANDKGYPENTGNWVG